MRFFDGSLETWNTDIVDFGIKEGAKPTCSSPYPVPKSHEKMLKK